MKRTVLLSTIILFAACTVKEDRLPCPCLIEFQAMPGLTWKSSDSFLFACWDASDEAVQNSKAESTVALVWGAALDGSSEAYAAKGMKYLAAIRGLEKSRITGGDIIIPKGEQADSISCYCVLRNCNYDKVTFPVDSTRHYAKLSLELECEGMPASSFHTKILGEINGINCITCRPVKGEFLYAADFDDSGILGVRLPRQLQGSGSLKMELYMDGKKSPLALIPVGDIMRRTGYDWERPCLQDFCLKLSYSMAGTGVSAGGWEDCYYAEEI